MTNLAATKLAILAAIALSLAGCQTIEERRAEQAARDDADCRSYGVRPGSAEYVRCRTELRRVRAEEERPVIVQTIRPSPIFVGPRPIFGPDPFGPRLCPAHPLRRRLLVMGAPSRHWPIAALLTLAALLHGATYLGLGMGAAVLWHSITAFYFQQSYAAGLLPAVVAGLLVLAVLLLVLRRAWLASGPAFLAMLACAAMTPRMGTASFLHPLIHPMQLVHWGAMALTVVGCLWLFTLTNRAWRPA